VEAVDDHLALFGQGVTHVGLAPCGRAPWPVRGTIKDTLTRERAQVEGGIGAIKHARYGFNKPAARSASAMAMCGQRAVLAVNLNKLVRVLARQTQDGVGRMRRRFRGNVHVGAGRGASESSP
jgi:hypothetical protein